MCTNICLKCAQYSEEPFERFGCIGNGISSDGKHCLTGCEMFTEPTKKEIMERQIKKLVEEHKAMADFCRRAYDYLKTEGDLKRCSNGYFELEVIVKKLNKKE